LGNHPDRTDYGNGPLKNRKIYTYRDLKNKFYTSRMITLNDLIREKGKKEEYKPRGRRPAHRNTKDHVSQLYFSFVRLFARPFGLVVKFLKMLFSPIKLLDLS
jgi:hypothetical protein